MTTAGELWARVQAAEETERAARARLREFGSFHPDSWSPEAEAAHDAEQTAWVDAEGARHDLDAFLNPQRYAEKGYEAEALDGFRGQAAAEAEPEAQALPASAPPNTPPEDSVAPASPTQPAPRKAHDDDPPRPGPQPARPQHQTRTRPRPSRLVRAHHPEADREAEAGQ
jgi:hypothetical protein